MVEDEVLKQRRSLMSRVTIFSELNLNNDKNSDDSASEEKKSMSDAYTQEDQALCIDEEPELLEDGDYSATSNKEDSKTDRD